MPGSVQYTVEKMLEKANFIVLFVCNHVIRLWSSVHICDEALRYFVFAGEEIFVTNLGLSCVLP